MLEGLRGVALGRDTTDKTANARVRAAELFMKSGSDPIIKQKPVVEINTGNKLTYIQRMDNAVAKMRSWTREERFEYGRTGVKPERIKNLQSEEE